MAKYIELERALALIRPDEPEDEKAAVTIATVKKFVRSLLDRAPAADVAPVVHGRWIADGDGYHWTYNCSICAWKDGYPFNERHNYCPNCGAKMDGDK